MMKLDGWIVMVYMAFFGVIAFAIWYTKSPNCLWALLLFPSLKVSGDCKCGDD